MDESMTERVEIHEEIIERSETPQPRAVGSPLPMGNGARPQPLHTEPEVHEEPSLEPHSAESHSAEPYSAPTSAPPLGRSLTGSSAPPPVSTLQRAVNVLRIAVPFMQKMLPLLDGNIGTAVANILNPPPPPAPPKPHIPPVDLAPLEAGMVELKTQHRELQTQISEQNSSLKRVEDQLEMVREATDRNTLEQQELLEDLKSVGGKLNLVAIIALGLLAISILLNLALYLHMQRVLP
jgi:hypothetical protein